jgi:hypothetical protein
MKNYIAIFLIFLLNQAVDVRGQTACVPLITTSWAVNQAHGEITSDLYEAYCWEFQGGKDVRATIHISGVTIGQIDTIDPLNNPSFELIDLSTGEWLASSFASDEFTADLIGFALPRTATYQIAISSSSASHGGYFLTIDLFAPPVVTNIVFPTPTVDTRCRGTTTNGLNLREGPSTDYPVIITLNRDFALEPQAYNQNWYYVTSDQINGWVSRDYVATTGDCSGLPFMAAPSLELPDPSIRNCSSRIDTVVHEVTITCSVDNVSRIPTGNVTVLAVVPNNAWSNASSLISLDANAEQPASLVLSYDTSLPADTYSLRVELQVDRDAAYDNNRYELTIRIPETATPPPAPEVDLLIRSVDTEIDSRSGYVEMTVTVGNNGNIVARNLRLHAIQIAADWSPLEATQNTLAAMSDTTMVLYFYPSESLWDTRHSIIIEILSDSSETRSSNNRKTVYFTLPAQENLAVTNPEAPNTNTISEESSLNYFIILGAVLAFTFFGTLFMFKKLRPPAITDEIYLHRQWEDQAKKDIPNKPCTSGNRYCRIEKIEPQYQLYEVKSLALTLLSHGLDTPVAQRKYTGNILEEINKELHFSGTKLEWEKLRRRMAQIAHALLDDLDNWLEAKSEIETIGFHGKIEGSEVEVEFTLYRCTGTSKWEKETSWTSTITDKRSLPIATLPYRAERDQQVLVLANGLVEMIKAI